MWTDAERRALALGGASLDDRLALAAAAGPTASLDPALADARWKAWVESATVGDAARFSIALAGEGIDEHLARRAVGLTAYPDMALPPWVDDAAWLARAATGPLAPPSAADGAPLPFEPIVRALGEAVVGRVEERLGRLPWRTEGRARVRGTLAAELAELCGPALLAAFVAARRPPPPGDGPAPDGQWSAFVRGLRDGGVWSFLLDRPVLARLAAQMAASAADALVEMLERLARDRERIGREILGGAPPGELADLGIGLSDPHAGRAVAILAFEGGERVVYKPRDCRVDLEWRRLARWLAGREPELAIRAPAVVAGDGYGWVEFVAHTPCVDVAAATRCYRRYGMLVAIAWVLGSRDLHGENVIAVGEDPVPIDLETLLGPDLAAFLVPPVGPGPRAAVEAARHALDHATTASLLLPTEIPAMQDRVFAVGALTPPGVEPYEGFAWVEPDTDRMRRVRRTGRRVRAAHSLPALGGGPVAPASHVDDIVDGFALAARTILLHRDALLAPEGPLAAFGPAEIRVILRSTQFYGLLAQRARTIAHLGDGVTWSRHFYYTWREPAPHPGHWPRLVAERAALARGDVPRFVLAADATTLELDAGRSVPAFTRSALAEARANVAALEPGAIAAEVRRIRIAFGLADEAPPPVRRPRAGASPAARRRRTGESIAALVAAQAIERDGGAAWVTRSPLVSHASSSACGVAGADLYNGATGIALYLGTLASVRGDARPATLALAALAPLRADIAERPVLVVEGLGIGGATGVGSIVYALARLATLLEDPTLRADARRLADAVGPDAIASDRVHDVIGGAAGLVLGLLPLHRATADARVLAIASRAGEHLLARRAPHAGFRVWSSGRVPALTGFSHGAAGIALALARLTAATGDPRFADAAREALAFERATYSSAHGGWADLRAVGGTAPDPHQWCHGSAGIGLARLAVGPHLDDPLLAGEVRLAVDATAAAPRSPVDHYCCGELGRIELLFTAGRRAADAGLVAEAERRLDALIAGAEARGGFRWIAGPDTENVGLFQGIAGVGYQLLRVDHPDAVPSVLAWDDVG